MEGSTVKERGILFSAPMVRALLAGTKTQTRRPFYTLTKHFNTAVFDTRYAMPRLLPPVDHSWTISDWRHVNPGDRLWVRETWAGPLVDADVLEAANGDKARFKSPAFCQYAADGGPRPEYMDADDNLRQRWTPAIHMFRWASRITLEVTGVRVERLQDISEADAKAEGCAPMAWVVEDPTGLIDWPLKERENPYRNGYALLWDQINGAGAWDANPWVWAVSFKRVTP